MNIGKSNIIIVTIWAYVIGTAVLQGYTLPMSPIARSFPLPWQIVLMPIIVVIGAVFNKHIPGAMLIGKRVDHWFGDDTYRSFMKSLKLELLFSAMSFGIGIAGFVKTAQVGGSAEALTLSGFFTCGGVAFLGAHVISRKRGLYERTSVPRG